MLDQNLFINDYEETKRRLTRKKVSVDQIEEIRKAILDRKAFIGEVDGLRAEINEKSKQVGILFQQGKKDEAEEIKLSVPKLKEVLAVKEEEFKKIDEFIIATKTIFQGLYGRGSVQHLKSKRNSFYPMTSKRLGTHEGTNVLKIIISNEI
jgi:seryl-tRNA synthetase